MNEQDVLTEIVTFVNLHAGCNETTQIMEDDNDSLMLFCGECSEQEQRFGKPTGYCLRVDVIPAYARMLTSRGHSDSGGLRTGGS